MLTPGGGLRIKIPKLLSRIGCGLAVVLWFMLLTLPCFAVVLATQGEILLTHSDIPFDDFRAWLIQQPRQRGIAISDSHRVSAVDGSNSLCTVLGAPFILRDGQPVPSPHSCSCYKLESGGGPSGAAGADA